ncbi:hypothetical protein CkaCkLH20_07469 [Colletotrichum karsti]|uniref:ubiquitinyl hydrolase 1 n=1 Tax=Colletotrichum karsti TaxID=1095194 RepID=A0A9P6LJ09_9PEZI|nr:uncharacterized protein CkaCkLH20_07469 [Colletotrichum karsti]KAF9875203.1 hypothetical protein CkaCkLH20_07469 [Colletotrichum karsti]
MFQPQPTPFASSFHAQPTDSHAHAHAHLHSHPQAHLPRTQHRASHNVVGYGMGIGGEMVAGSDMGGVEGTEGGGGGGGVGMMATGGVGGGGGGMNNYSFPADTGVMGVQVASSSDANCMGMGLAAAAAAGGHHGHGQSMGSPLAHGRGHNHNGLGLGGMSSNNMNMGMTGMNMNMDMGLLQSQSQSPSQSLSLGGVGEPAPAGAAGAAAAPPAVARPPASRYSGSRRSRGAGTGIPVGTGAAAALTPPEGLYSTPSPASRSGSHLDLDASNGGGGGHSHSPGASSRSSHSHRAGAGAGAGASSSSSSTFYNPSISNSNPNTNTAPASAANSASTRPSTMDPGDSSDFAAQEAAARDYQPQLEGPLVGDKTTSDAITDEYAKADDVYVAKTIALPQTYSHYRPIQGDGNCGWRAIGFSYFEHLANNGDHDQILGEVARITSLNQYLLNVGGYDRMLFEDMVDETIALLRDLADNISNRQLVQQIVMQRFNDQDVSNAIIYHLRLLASSWLKGNSEDYAPFIPGDLGVFGYCAELERPNVEIEHLGLQLLVQVLLKPVNMVLEIAYLDRSAGSQVNSYRIPNEAMSQDPANLGPIIYLLYRPDHYDILYKSPPNPAPHALNLQVNRATSFSHRQEIMSVTPSLQTYTNMDYSPLAMLPGFGGPPSGLSSGLSSALSSLGSPASASPMPDAYDAPPQSPWMPAPYSDHLQQQPPPQQQQPVPTPRPQPQSTPQPQSQQSTPTSGKPSQPVDYQLRFSHQCWHLSNSGSSQPSMLPSQSSFPEPSFTTAMFKNSHFNKAHYQNPQFHPEEWTPDDEGHERVPSAKKKGRVKSEH